MLCNIAAKLAAHGTEDYSE